MEWKPQATKPHGLLRRISVFHGPICFLGLGGGVPPGPKVSAFLDTNLNFDAAQHCKNYVAGIRGDKRISGNVIFGE